MGIFSYQPLNKSMCPPVHPSHIFACTTLRFYKKIFSKLCMYSGKIHKSLHNFDRIIFDGIIAFFTSPTNLFVDVLLHYKQ